MTNNLNDDRIRQALRAEATELEARRRDGSSGVGDLGVGSLGEELAGRTATTPQRQWRKAVLPVAAVLLAVVGVIGFNINRDAAPDRAEPASELASRPPQSTAEVPEMTPAPVAASPSASAPARGAAAPTPVDAAAGRLLYHTVAPGDVLSAIADRYGVTIDALIMANQLDPSELVIGQELLIPPSPGPVATSEVVERAPTPVAPVRAIEVVPTIGVAPIELPLTVSCVSGIIAPDVLNLRSGPSLDEPIIAELRPDECGLRMVAGSDIVDGTWVHLDRQVDDTIIRGWASLKFLRPDYYQPPEPTPVLPTPVLPPSPLCVVGVTAPDALMLRSGPGLEFDVLREMPPGTCQLLPLVSSNGWTQLAVPDGRGNVTEGWASSAYLGSGPGTGTGTGGGPVVGPDVGAGQVRLAFTLSFAIEPPPGTRPPDAAAFELLTEEGALVARLDTAATATVDASIVGSRLQVSAPFANDPYCWWNGVTTAQADAVVEVVLAALCA